MKWVCTVCGHQHKGNEAPDKCPRCGSDKVEFDDFPELNFGVTFERGE